jgi:serine/threonine-protein kinase HSL1, negative regulator of Swe1 kinase
MGMDVRVMLEGSDGLGVLKCRLDDVKDPVGVMNVLKAVKFRVELHHLRQEGYEVSLFLVHEKGAMETMKEVFKRLRKEWSLDIIGARIPFEVLPSPALAVGGRFTEVELFDSSNAV